MSKAFPCSPLGILPYPCSSLEIFPYPCSPLKALQYPDGILAPADSVTTIGPPRLGRTASFRFPIFPSSSCSVPPDSFAFNGLTNRAFRNDGRTTPSQLMNDSGWLHKGRRRIKCHTFTSIRGRSSGPLLSYCLSGENLGAPPLLPPPTRGVKILDPPDATWA